MLTECRYIDCCYHPFQEPPSLDTCIKVRQKTAEKFVSFYNFCSKLEGYFAGKDTTSSTPTPVRKNDKDDGSKGKSKAIDFKNESEDEDDDDPQPLIKRSSQLIT